MGQTRTECVATVLSELRQAVGRGADALFFENFPIVIAFYALMREPIRIDG